MQPYRFLFFLFAAVSPLVGQFQAANQTARRAGLEVRAIESNNTNGNVRNQVTLNGPPGAPFITLFEVGGAFDRAFNYQLGGIHANPYVIDLLGGAWGVADPLLAPLSVGVIPPSGTVARSFPFPIPLPPGLTLRMQAVVVDNFSAANLAASNGVIKTVSPQLPRPNWAAKYRMRTPGPSFPRGDYLDVEQGDIDGDGDHDTLLLECGTGKITALLQVSGKIGNTIRVIATVPGASAMELADIDNDNWLDLVVSIDGLQGVQVLLNRTRLVGLGSTLMGPWRGFLPLPPSIVNWDASIIDPPFALDVETADYDQDGYIDILLGCARPQAMGLPNRLLRNSMGTPGGIGFVERTVPDLFPTNLRMIRDDSEDIEFSDLDKDGDMDIVVSNYDGPAQPIGAFPPFGIGVEIVHINQGFAQGGAVGTYRARTIVANPPGDESIDVLVKDFDGDGFDDIYVSNWYATQGNTGPITANPVFDRLYLTRGTALGWRDFSTMLPDNPNYVGPPAARVPAWASSDAEATDADLFTWPNWGGMEILVSSGRRCNRAVAPARGLRLLNYVPAVFGSFPAHYVNDSFPAGGGIKLLPARLQTMDINDIETGDWARTYWDQDFGLATAAGTISPGHVWCIR